MHPMHPTKFLATCFIVSNGDIRISLGMLFLPAKYEAPPEPIDLPNT